MFANAATARLLNLGSAEEVTTATPEQLMALYDVFDEPGARDSIGGTSHPRGPPEARKPSPCSSGT